MTELDVKLIKIRTPGLQGIAGPQGIQGLTGPAGAQGIQGIQGVAGPQGIQGLIGPDGLSAYEVAVANGFVGSEAAWLASLVGAQGPQGSQGVQGIQGPAGNDGAPGKIIGGAFFSTNTAVLVPTGGAYAIPFDDTPPLNTEGYLAMTLDYQAQLADSYLDFDVMVQMGVNTSWSAWCCTLCCSDITNALNIVVGRSDAAACYPLAIRHSQLAAATTNKTYQVRLGTPWGDKQIGFNRNASGTTFGGVLTSSICILERRP